MPRLGGCPGRGAGKDVVGGQAGRKSLIRLFAHAGQREGSAPPADVRSALRIKSPSVHSLGTQLSLNTAPVPSQIAQVFLRWRELGARGWCPWPDQFKEQMRDRNLLVVKV